MTLSPNSLLHNNYFNNTLHLLDNDAMNWDGGYPAGGNFYDTHTGPDVDMDGICDDPLIFDGDSRDRYPLMAPYAGQLFVEKLAPYSVSWEPTDINVSVTATIEILWNETMNWTSVNTSFSYTDNVTIWNSTNGTWVHNSTTNTSYYTPAVPFGYQTEYWVTVNVTATDLVGNPLDQNQSGIGGEWPADMLLWNFTTVAPPETVPPLALNYSPNGTNIAIDSNIVIEWNETMNWTSVAEAFNYTDGVTVFNSTHGVWSHNSTTNVSTFNPTYNFDYEVQYNVTVNCTAADVIGNQLDQSNNSIGGEWPEDVLEWNFTTTDSPPWIVSTIPANNQIEVPPDTIVKVIFSEGMNTTAVEGAFSYSNATTTWGITDGTVYWGAGDSEFTFVPTTPFENNMTYTVHFIGAVTTDLGGKGMGFNYSWSFTTWTEPPLPQVIDVDPEDGASGMPINININVEFDVAMNHTTTESAFSYTDGSETWSGSDGVFVWSANNASFSFVPDDGLYHNTTYTVTVDGTATSTYGKSLDGDGDGVIGVDDSYTFSFSTALAPPYVIWTNPLDGATDIRVGILAIMINFNKIMDIDTVNAALTFVPPVNHTNVWRGGNYNLTILLDEDLEEGTFYQVKILSTATDIFGTRLDGNHDGVAGDNYVLPFITEGANISAAPYVISVFPPPGNVTVPINVFVGISFSTAMNRTSVENAFSFTNASGSINGTFGWATATTMRFVPAQDLAHNTTYFVSVDTGAVNVNGLAMEEKYSWQFTTGKVDGPSIFDDNWWMIAIIVVLLIIICAQYLKNRGTEMQLRRARVKIKKLKSGSQDVVDQAPSESMNGDDTIPEKDNVVDTTSEGNSTDNPHQTEEGVPRQ
jgi:hypothetical protein